ncbi:MAG TPA: glycoside hydrolase family 28 protein [Opitutaceae bacterium]|nr:glycoside hydrolase family 28 protein [Opitutaceae bacterium]
MKSLLFCALFCAALPASAAVAPRAWYNVRDYGATGDGRTLDTSALNRAVRACAAAGGGTVYLPPGAYLSGTVELKSHVALDLDSGATLLGSENPEDYPSTPSVWGDGGEMMAPLLYAVDADNITITGRGTIDGQGAIWWRRVRLNNPRKYPPGPQTEADRAEARKLSRGRPRLIRLVRCKDVLIEHVSLRNSAEWNVHPMLCENVRIDGITITAPAVNAHNTDGIDPEACRNVQIVNCRIDTGDDCVTLKSGLDELGRRMGKPDENITIANCVMYRGHGGVTIGSEMSGGVRNVVVTNCVFDGTDIGIRIKSQRGRGGVVEGISVSNVVMQNVPSPFTITTFYAGGDRADEIRPVDEGTPRYRDMLFSNITARGARSAGAITGLREMPIEDITFSNVHIQAATGFTCTNARNITFLDTVIDTQRGPALMLDHATDIRTERLRTETPHPDVPLVMELKRNEQK